MKINLTTNPIKSFIVYEGVFNIIALVIILIIGLPIRKYYLGFLLGSFAITLGFFIISKHVNRVIDTVISEKGAKGHAMLYFVIRLLVYGVVTVFAFEVVNVHFLTYILGLLTLQVIIYLDHMLNKTIGGE